MLLIGESEMQVGRQNLSSPGIFLDDFLADS